MQTKDIQKCKQCGEVKSLSQFREYYGKLTGHYKVCLPCEKVNQRYKYLTRKANIREDEEAEIKAIDELYALQRMAGLQPPRRRVKAIEEAKTYVNEQKQKLQERIEYNAELADEVPAELQGWLTMSFEAEDPEDLQAKIDDLWNKYRPQIGVDENYNAKFDERWTEILNQIQDRKDTYEEEFYAD